jgi:glycosyltransferase involved in cell wall biosynthesis
VRTLHFVVPDGIDDPARPSGGNTYDRNLCRGFTSLGWSVHEHPVPGFWSEPDAAPFAALEAAMGRIPDGGLALLDGLVASPSPHVLVPHARRLRLVLLVHMPLGLPPGIDDADEIRMRERAVLAAADAVVTTSRWSRDRLMELYALPADRLHVAEPGVQPAELATGTATGEALLTVAAVITDKGHDLLLNALATIPELPWRWVCVGSTDRDPSFVELLRQRSREHGLADRVLFAGTATGADLDRAYAEADTLVLASRTETYGMVVTEALARGVPVITTDVGGVTEALGHGSDGTQPGLVVTADDPTALADALRSWLTDAELRARLRLVARERRESLRGWSATTSVIAGILTGLNDD